MGLVSDLKVLYHLAFKPVRGKDHAARMESFYSGQAEAYDDFRKRLLKGRQELWNAIHEPEGAVWVGSCRSGQLRRVTLLTSRPTTDAAVSNRIARSMITDQFST